MVQWCLQILAVDTVAVQVSASMMLCLYSLRAVLEARSELPIEANLRRGMMTFNYDSGNHINHPPFPSDTNLIEL